MVRKKAVVKNVLKVEEVVNDVDMGRKGVKFVWEYDEKRVGVRRLVSVENI